jgi:hypothetical protein
LERLPGTNVRGRCETEAREADGMSGRWASGSERINTRSLFQLGDLARQLGDRCLQNVPDKFQIDPIAKTGNLRPWNRGLLRLNSRGSCFASSNYFEIAHDRVDRLFVGKK